MNEAKPAETRVCLHLIVTDRFNNQYSPIFTTIFTRRVEDRAGVGISINILTERSRNLLMSFA